MIRQRKYKGRPKGLPDSKGNGKLNFSESVKAQLLADQHNLCYLCGRRLDIDFEIEHLRSRAGSPRLKSAWSNLLLCCSYCNMKKGSYYDGILNPLEEDVEDKIYQGIDFERGLGVFRAVDDDASREVLETISLLEKIYNGTNRFRTTREQRFFNYTSSVVGAFIGDCQRWLKERGEVVYGRIERALAIDAEMLGFKYWVVRGDARLNAAFGWYMRWNRGGVRSSVGSKKETDNVLKSTSSDFLKPIGKDNSKGSQSESYLPAVRES